MTRPDAELGPEDRRLAEAAAWQIRLRQEGLETSPGFEAWIAADPLNRDAHERAEAAWAEIGEMSTTSEFVDLRRRSLEIAARQARRLRGARSWAGPLAAALAAVVVLGIAGAGGWWLNRPQVFETRLGERRVVPLADGSRVSLDSGSEVTVKYTPDARKLVLVRGQARFDVAHNVERPFSVRAGDETVVATGTAFNIDLFQARTLVTLIEGRVVVIGSAPRSSSPAATSRRPTVTLTPGQELISASGAGRRVVKASLDRTTAWQDGRLVFDNEPLGVIAARVSRYSEHPLVVDPAAAQLRLSGVFETGDVPGFVDTMTAYLPLRASTRPDGAILLTRR